MVERRITDGRRVAELLASEVDGRADGPFARLAVTGANRDVEPSPDGGRAYDIRLTTRGGSVGEDDGDARAAGEDDESARTEGENEEDALRLARVFVHDDGATLALKAGREAATNAADVGDLPVEGDPSRGDGTAVRVPSAAAAKRAADVVTAAARAVADAEASTENRR